MTTLRVGYGSKKLEGLCTDELEMQKKRADIASCLKLRIKALEVAEKVGDLVTFDPLGKWHELVADHRGLWAGKVSRNHRLLIRPEGEGLAAEAECVTVVDIVDYH